MRRNFLLILFVMACIAGITYFSDRERISAPKDMDHPELEVLSENPAPDFSFDPMKKDKTHSLNEFKERVVILNFWASWCAPCVVEFPKLEKIARLYPENIVVIAASVDTKKTDIEKFLSKSKLRPPDNFLIFHDKDRRISQDLFQTIRFPETIIIDPAGQMVRKVVGDTDWTGEDMRAYLSGLASQKPIP